MSIILKSNIPNALHSVAEDHITAVASDIYDEVKEKYQNAINSYVLDALGEELLPNAFPTLVESLAALEIKSTTADNILALGAKATLSANPSVLFKNVATSVTFTGSVTNIQANQIESWRILDGSTVLIENTTTSISYTPTNPISLSDNTKTFKLEVIVAGMTFPATVTINARYPIYYGFAANVDAIPDAIAANPATIVMVQTAVTSAARTYSMQNNADGQHFYILVPTDISDVNTFIMGSQFVMNTLPNITINGASYRVHQSGVAYNSGKTVTVEARA